MTAKELLLGRVRLLTEDEAEELLHRMDNIPEDEPLDPTLEQDLGERVQSVAPRVVRAAHWAAATELLLR